MFYKTFATACLGIALALSSCTLSSDNDEPTAPADSYRLSSITVNGVFTVSKFDYDSQGRLTQILLGDSKIEFSYQGTSTLPSQIVEIEYSRCEDSDGVENQIYESERITWSDMVYDKNGLLTSASYEETNGYERYSTWDNKSTIEYETTYSVQRQEYDASGHMIKTVCHTDGESDEITTFVWNGDLLVKYYDNASPIEITEYEYSDVVNTTSFCDPFTAVGSFLNMTGIFGRNPAKFVKKITYTNGSYKEVSQLAYSLNPNGLVDKMKLLEDEEEITYKFNYSTK